MKRIFVILAMLLIVGAAYAGDLEFTLTGIENSTPEYQSVSYPDYACQVINRTGISNVVIELQGSIKPSISNDLSWVALANSAVVNTTAAGASNSSWHFQSLDAYATTIRMKVLSGAGVGVPGHQENAVHRCGEKTLRNSAISHIFLL